MIGRRCASWRQAVKSFRDPFFLPSGPSAEHGNGRRAVRRGRAQRSGDAREMVRGRARTGPIPCNDDPMLEIESEKPRACVARRAPVRAAQARTQAQRQKHQPPPSESYRVGLFLCFPIVASDERAAMVGGRVAVLWPSQAQASATAERQKGGHARWRRGLFFGRRQRLPRRVMMCVDGPIG